MLGPHKVVDKPKQTDNVDLFILEDVHSKARTAPTNADKLVPLDFYSAMLREQVAETDNPAVPITDGLKRTRLRRAEPGKQVSVDSFRSRVGQFLVFRRPGETRSLDPELRSILETCWRLVSNKENGIRTGEIAAEIYTANPLLKQVVKAAGGFRGVLKFTPSLEIKAGAAGGDNFVRAVPGETQLRLYDSTLGEQLRFGRLTHVEHDAG